MAVISAESESWPGKSVNGKLLRNTPLHAEALRQVTAQAIFQHLPVDFADLHIYCSYAGTEGEDTEHRYYLRISDNVFYHGVTKRRREEVQAFIRGYLACLRSFE